MEDEVRQMMDDPNSQMEFTIQRTVKAQDRDSLSASLSKEAFDSLHHSMAAWVGSRILRYNGETGLMPQNIRVTVDVQVNA